MGVEVAAAVDEVDLVSAQAVHQPVPDFPERAPPRNHHRPVEAIDLVCIESFAGDDSEAAFALKVDMHM